jgi:hypothetical protein
VRQVEFRHAYVCVCDAGGTVPEEEIRQAEEKFVESKELAEIAMHNLLTNDVCSALWSCIFLGKC